MSPKYRINAYSIRKEGVADPAGQTIKENMPIMGFDTVTRVRLGSAFRFVLEAASEQQVRQEATEMLEIPLFNERYNPLIDDLVIESVKKVRSRKPIQSEGLQSDQA